MGWCKEPSVDVQLVLMGAVIMLQLHCSLLRNFAKSETEKRQLKTLAPHRSVSGMYQRRERVIENGISKA